MAKETKILVIILLSMLVFSVAFTFYSSWKGMREAGYQSCLASIANEVYKLEATKSLAARNKDWKIVSAEDTNSLMSQVHGYDCSVDNQTFDLWNNRINIALRKTNKIEIIVWSNGADEVAGTNDDLVIPYGEKVPQ